MSCMYLLSSFKWSDLLLAIRSPANVNFFVLPATQMDRSSVPGNKRFTSGWVFSFLPKATLTGELHSSLQYALQ